MGFIDSLKLHVSNRDWVSIINTMEGLSHEYLYDKRYNPIFVEALRNLGRFLDANKLESDFYSCVGGVSPYLASKLVLDGDHRNSEFDDFMEVILKEKEEKILWREFIRLVATSDLAGFEKYLIELSAGSDSFSKYKKIFVSGFERSGTGALRDFINEYSEVYEIPGSEVQFIAGVNGLGKLYKDYLSGRGLESFKAFFIANALGFSALENYLDFKERGRANILIRESNEKRLLSAFVKLYFDIFHRGVDIVIACRSFVDNFLFSIRIPIGKTRVFFNNVINARNIWMFRLVDDYLCFPVTRDPRSQYASKITTRMPNIDPVHFVKTFRKTQRLYQEGLDFLGCDSLFIHEVKFEDIVLSEHCRLNIAKLCGLDEGSANRFTRLKPEESKVNVYLHKTDSVSSRKSDFDFILKELKDYCVIDEC